MQLVELPSFEATWWPVVMETIPGSGERLTVAVIARAASGQAQARQCVPPATLAGIFGADTGRGVQSMVGTTIIDLQHQLDAGVPVEATAFAFGGFHRGNARDCVARDFNEVFDIAVRLTAAFGQSAFGRRLEVSDSSRRAFDDWADRVQTELLTHTERVTFDGVDFNVRIKLARKPVRFGLVRGGYAANFGVLRPGHTPGDMRSLKVKVFDLEALRRDQIVPLSGTDVLVGCPTRDSMAAYSRREMESFYTSIEFIENEARARQVDLVRCTTPADAAAHIRRRLAA